MISGGSRWWGYWRRWFFWTLIGRNGFGVGSGGRESAHRIGDGSQAVGWQSRSLAQRSGGSFGRVKLGARALHRRRYDAAWQRLWGHGSYGKRWCRFGITSSRAMGDSHTRASAWAGGWSPRWGERSRRSCTSVTRKSSPTGKWIGMSGRATRLFTGR